ncbi:DUF3107 domain-containing protein [Arthrobacter sp. NamB2]|uniref:DUF3107 domain-containing protein n=1 Tax=unclassified Arthrobacter TaxID=235627 RepID=UPI000CE39CA3|nr:MULTISPECIES: DUF3107 domain-containing protein [unclassified Arthrobacter]TKV29651.1 DUF3107 domain-containing protein [Arthrobacter sp. NamB2]
MEVKIGIQNVNREIILDSSESADAIAELVAQAMTSGSELRLKDSKGRQVIVPTSVLGYVEIGAEETRRVGFGAL